MRLLVHGFGLLGGSVALGARARGLASHITAVDLAPVLASERCAQLADDRVAADDPRWVEAAARAELCLLAGPVSVIADVLPRLLDVARLITDCGSTKRVIVAAAASHPRRGRYVPGHPMAGDPRGGLERASAHLFAGHSWVLCPEAVDPDALDTVEQLVRSLDARPLRLEAARHDDAVAWTSHVPQLLASALAVHAAEAARSGARGPGFASATRIAGGPHGMWRDILLSNSDAVGGHLQELARTLAELAEQLQRGDTQRSLALLAQARALRDSDS